MFRTSNVVEGPMRMVNPLPVIALAIYLALISHVRYNCIRICFVVAHTDQRHLNINSYGLPLTLSTYPSYQTNNYIPSRNYFPLS